MDAVRLYNAQCVTVEDRHAAAHRDADVVAAAMARYESATGDTAGAGAIARYAQDLRTVADVERARRLRALSVDLAAELGEHWPADGPYGWEAPR